MTIEFEREDDWLIDIEQTAIFSDEEESFEEVDIPSEKVEEEQFKDLEEETAVRNQEIEKDDGFEKELEIIQKEGDEQHDESIDEILNYYDVDSNFQEEKPKSYIQHGLALKGFINPQNIIKERNQWSSFFDFISSENHNKTSLRVLFFSNSLTSFLGENYLEYYTFEDILAIYQKASKGENFLETLFKHKTLKTILSYYKKYILASIKFGKIKVAKTKSVKKKKEEENFNNQSLFDFPTLITNQGQESPEREIQNKFAKLQEEIALLDDKKQYFLNFNKFVAEHDTYKEKVGELISLPTACNVLLIKLFIKNITLDKTPVKEKYQTIETDKDWNPIQSFSELLSEETLRNFSDEIKSLVASFKSFPKKRELSNSEKNDNIQKYLDAIGFMDNKVWEYLADKFGIKKKVSRVSLLSKMISGNESFKLEVMKQIISDPLDFKKLEHTIKQQKKIEDLRFDSKKALMTLNLKEIAITLSSALQPENWRTKEFFKENKDYQCVLDIATYTNLGEKGNKKWRNKFLETLQIINKGVFSSDEAKKDFFIDDIKPNDKGVYEKIPITFENKVKNVIIELFIKSINEFLDEIAKNAEYKKQHNIKVFGYITGKNFFDKNKLLVYIREKGEYACSLYGMSSNIFTKLRGLGVLSVKVNWSGEEIIDHIKYFSLSEKTEKEFDESLIPLEKVKCFKNFKKKIILYSKFLGWDSYMNYENFQNTLKNVSANGANNFLFFRYEKQNEQLYFFFSDGEISVKMTAGEYRKLIKNSKTGEDRDFVNTTKIISQTLEEHPDFRKELYKTTLSWLDEDWERRTGDVYTNLTCNTANEEYLWRQDRTYQLKIPNFFENGVHKGLLSYYMLYYHQLFNKNKEIELNGKKYKGIIVFDLETIGFTGNIILSYFLVITHKTVILYRYSHKEFGDFFDKMASWDYMFKPFKDGEENENLPFGTPISNSFASLEEKLNKWLNGKFILSGHNTLSFDNKKMAEDVTQDKIGQEQLKKKIDSFSIDVLAVLMQNWYGRLGLDHLSKINFDFGKNIKKGQKGDLMDTILQIQHIIKMEDKHLQEREIQKNKWIIEKFIVYNKNDVLMSLGLLGQLMAYWMLATGKKLANINQEQLAMSLI